MKKSNIVLIGMPAAGKSTIGTLLSKTAKMPLIDTDLLIREKSSQSLQDILNNDGLQAFLNIEEQTILALCVENHIIATGGSAIYSLPAITHLKKEGVLVYLHLKYHEIERRLKNIATRGIAMQQDQTLSSLYLERVPLYKNAADITIYCSNKHIEKIIFEIFKKTRYFF